MWIGNTKELKLVFIFLAVGYLGYFVLFLEKKNVKRRIVRVVERVQITKTQQKELELLVW